MSPTDLADAVREHQEAVIGHVLGLGEPDPLRWGIQRADGLFWTGSIKGEATRTYTFGEGDPMRFLTEQSAQAWIDSMANSYAGRVAFRGCKPARLFEPGDHVVCACGQLHEACYCPAEHGHGVVL